MKDPKKRLKEFLFGTAYYHEYHPVERLEEDVRLIKEAGMNVVRLGESTWTLWEPEDGRFEFEWIDRVIEAFSREGIKIILGTPTYATPAWMQRKSPEVTRINLDGRPEPYGHRQTADIGHPAYRFYCERLLRTIIPRYQNHPDVIGWQLDNETDTYGMIGGPRVEKDFVDHLKKKFGTPEALNAAWGLNYWSKNIHAWEDMFPRQNTSFPQHRLEWERFIQGMITDFLEWHAAIVRELAGDHQFITHDFSIHAFQNTRMRDVNEFLDYSGINPYDSYQDRYQGNMLNAFSDCAWALNDGPFMTLETAAGVDGNSGYFPPYDNQLKLNAYTFLAAGTNTLLYWHWHSIHYGSEMAFMGLLPHDYVPGRLYNEARELGDVLKRIGPDLHDVTKTKEVAILHDIDSLWSHRHEPLQPKVDYYKIFMDVSLACNKLHAECDVLLSIEDLKPQHKVLLVPPLHVASKPTLDALCEFVKRGGHLLLWPRAGRCDEFMRVRWEPLPAGELGELSGVRYQEVSTLEQPVVLKSEEASLKADGEKAFHWADLMSADSAQVLMGYDHPFYGKYAALTCKEHSSGGSLTCLGTIVEESLLKEMISGLLNRANIEVPEAPECVRVRKSKTSDGKGVTFYLNYSPEPQSVTYPYGDGEEKIRQVDCPQGCELQLEPWGAAIVMARSSE